MDNEDKKIEEQEARPAKDLEIDESLLSEEEKANNKIRYPKGMLIFIIIVILLIVGLSIAVILL
jgi:predicted nucleic acid-binding Zn ribbon protein